ncbi:hypothetical protein D3C72_2256150 [compost metagenome]
MEETKALLASRVFVVHGKVRLNSAKRSRKLGTMKSIIPMTIRTIRITRMVG